MPEAPLPYKKRDSRAPCTLRQSPRLLFILTSGNKASEFPEGKVEDGAGDGHVKAIHLTKRGRGRRGYFGYK